jgi:Metallo-beta-lactamase superfamily
MASPASTAGRLRCSFGAPGATSGTTRALVTLSGRAGAGKMTRATFPSGPTCIKVGLKIRHRLAKRWEDIMKRNITLLAGSLLAALLLNANLGHPAAAQEQAARPKTLSESYRDAPEFQKIAPFKVFDNLYHVGLGFVDAWLIPTSAGIIMIDTTWEPYVDHVMDNIKTLGFDLKDVKYILISHGHLDHFGGAAKIQQASGARVGATEEDWQMIEEAGKQPGRNGAAPPLVPKRDMVIMDGDTLTLGDTTLKFYKTPGHTPGVLSAEFVV